MIFKFSPGGQRGPKTRNTLSGVEYQSIRIPGLAISDECEDVVEMRGDGGGSEGES